MQQFPKAMWHKIPFPTLQQLTGWKVLPNSLCPSFSPLLLPSPLNLFRWLSNLFFELLSTLLALAHFFRFFPLSLSLSFLQIGPYFEPNPLHLSSLCLPACALSMSSPYLTRLPSYWVQSPKLLFTSEECVANKLCCVIQVFIYFETTVEWLNVFFLFIQSWLNI